MFIAGYEPTYTQDARNKHAFWTAPDRIVRKGPEHEELCMLMEVNACTGRRGGGKLGSEECKVFGVCRDTLNDDGERLL